MIISLIPSITGMIGQSALNHHKQPNTSINNRNDRTICIDPKGSTTLNLMYAVFPYISTRGFQDLNS
jgi:hypothetical protein